MSALAADATGLAGLEIAGIFGQQFLQQPLPPRVRVVIALLLRKKYPPSRNRFALNAFDHFGPRRRGSDTTLDWGAILHRWRDDAFGVGLGVTASSLRRRASQPVESSASRPSRHGAAAIHNSNSMAIKVRG